MLTFLLKILIIVSTYLGQSYIFASEIQKNPIELEEILIDLKSKNCNILIERKIDSKGTSFKVEASPPISHQSCYSLANRLDQIVKEFAKTETESFNEKHLIKSQHAKLQPVKTSKVYKLFKFLGYSTITAVSIGATAWLTLNWSKLNVADHVTSYLIKMNICSYILPNVPPPPIINQPPAPPSFFCEYNIFSPFFHIFGCPY